MGIQQEQTRECKYKVVVRIFD